MPLSIFSKTVYKRILDVDGQGRGGGGGLMKIAQFSWTSYVYQPLAALIN